MLSELKGGNPQSIKKRVKERSVIDALNRVREWRRIYEQGKDQQNTNQPRISLKEAANLVKIPKKTLEDYIQIFNKVSLICRVEEFSNKRMGFLRSFIQKNKAYIQAANKIRKEKKKQYMDDSFNHKVKIEFESMSPCKDIKLELNQEIKQEIKEEEFQLCTNNQFSSQNKF